MKLIIILSVIACNYAAKLDRTYLPPASAATAGGSPGSLSAPGSAQGPQGPSSLSQPSGSAQGPQSGPAGFAQLIQSGFNQDTFGVSSGPTGANGPAFGQAANFGQAPTTYFGNQGAQDAPGYSAQYQPERARASLDTNAEILRYDNQNDGDSFAYSFETSNGIAAEESGVATNGVQAQGGYSYTGDDGQQYRVTYTADENGYQPQGDHLPTPHPIPEEILKSIEENARAAAAGTQEGAYNPDEDSSLGPQQYNIGVTSYQASNSYNQPGQSPSSQYGAPSSTGTLSESQALQSNQYQPGSNQGPAQYSSGSANAGFAPSGSESQNQRPGFAPSGPVSFGPQKSQQRDQSGYQYNRPQFGRTIQGSGQFRPQTEGQSSQVNRPQGPASSRPSGQGFGPADASQSGPINNQGPKGFGPAQSSPNSAYTSGSTQNSNGLTFTSGPSGLSESGQPQSSFSSANNPNIGSLSRPNGIIPQGSSSGPTSGQPQGAFPSSTASQGSFPKPNAGQSYSPAGSTAPGGQGSSFPGSNYADQGYNYGPGISPAGTKNTGSPAGQNFGSSGSSFGPTGSSFSGFPQGPAPRPGQGYSSSNLGSPSGSAQGPQGSAFLGQNGNQSPQSGSFPSGFAQAPRGSSQNGATQSPQGTSFPSPSGSAQAPQGSGFPSQNGLTQGPQGASYPRPIGQAPAGTPANAAGPFGTQPSRLGASMPQSTPYQYNKPGSQGAQSQAGSQPGFRTEGSPGQNFGGPRQPPSFSPEEGYKY